MIKVNQKIKIPECELNFRYLKSSGPGGQHVNKANTRATLSWDLATTESLNSELRDWLSLRLSNRLNEEGFLIIHSDRFRSQDRNKKDCIERFVNLLRTAAQVPKTRKKTKPTKAAKERRLKEKKNRSEVKKLRKKSF